MTSLHVHEIEARLAPGDDPRVLGGAVTTALCGHWEHEGPCRWPHVTKVVARSGDSVTARVVFACDAGEETEVRSRIAGVLRAGRLDGPSGRSTWRLVREVPVEPSDEERRIGSGW